MVQLTGQEFDEDTQRLLEELELQNDELRCALVELEESRNEQAEFYELAPIGFLTVDKRLNILEGNEAVAKLFSVQMNDLISSNFIRFVSHESQIHLLEHLEKARKQGVHSVDLRLGRPGVLTFIAHLITHTMGEGEDKRYRMIIEDITDRKRAEAALRESEEKFAKAFYDNAANMLLARADDGQIIDVNDAMLEATGYAREELIGQSTLSLGIWKNPEQREQFIRDLRRNGFVHNRECEFVGKNGKKGVTLMSGQLITLDGVELMLSSSTDITDRKKVEEALRESQEKFSKAFHGTVTAQAIVGLDDGMIIEANEKWFELFGTSHEEAIGRTTFELNIWPNSEDRKEFVRELEEKGFIQDREFEFLGRRCKLWTALMSVQVMELQGRKLIMSSVFDITERKKAEQALKESEEKFRGISDASPAAVIVWRSDRSLYVNPATVSILGYTEGEMLAMNFLDLIHPESQAIVREATKARMSGRRKPARYDVKVITKDGEEKWLDVSTNLITYEGSRAGIVVGIDITDVKHAKKVAEQYSDELKRSNAELQQFAHIASHDLREPLRMISSYLGLLEKKYQGKLDEKADEYIGFAIDGAERMQQLIDDILAYSRVETRGKPFIEVDTNEVLAVALKDLKGSIEETGASITHDDLPLVQGDRAQMILLLENLLGNSIKFRDVEAPQINISVESKGNDWLFSARDNGIGIPREQQERIFEMFQRLHTKQEYEGTGIGLAICRKIIERHGGRIWVDSIEGEGATFYFTIPKKQKNAGGPSLSLA